LPPKSSRQKQTRPSVSGLDLVRAVAHEEEVVVVGEQKVLKHQRDALRTRLSEAKKASGLEGFGRRRLLCAPSSLRARDAAHARALPAPSAGAMRNVQLLSGA
jgi:hypothetical protein